MHEISLPDCFNGSSEFIQRRARACKEALEFTVPILICEFERNGLPEIGTVQKVLGPALKYGDEYLYGSPDNLRRQEFFYALAQGIAYLAFQWGGVKFLGRHWEAGQDKYESVEI